LLLLLLVSTGDPPLSLPAAPHTSAHPPPTGTKPQEPAAGAPPKPQEPRFSWVPLVPSAGDFYRVKLSSISLGGKELSVPDGVYDQGHGTILDSGTTYLCVPTPVKQVRRGGGVLLG